MNEYNRLGRESRRPLILIVGVLTSDISFNASGSFD
jgi:hypothetical protein